MPRSVLALIAASLWTGPCHGAEVQLYFSALQRILAEQVFTQEGRLYMRGDAKNKCNFAYLEHPAVAADNGRLLVKARFSGRSARSFFGKCLGMGDSFDVRISASPSYTGGMLALRDVKVESPGRDSFCIRRVRAAMSDSLAKNFQYSLARDAKRMFEEQRPGAVYRQQLQRFEVREIQVLADSILIVLDFRIAVR
jgi:hypothetical protein